VVVGEVASPVDLLVIGGGPGGYSAALQAAQLGREVLLIENQEVGGTCINVGCIPSKALIEIANTIHAPTRLSSYGVRTDVTIDIHKIRTHLNSLVNTLTSNISSSLKRAGVQVRPGTVRFSRPNRVAVEHADNLEHFEFRHAIVATGSRSIELPGLSVDGKRIVNSTDLLFASKLPETLVLVGGGYIGVELACAYAKLGTHVTVIESKNWLLPTFEKRIGLAVERGLRRLGVGICLASSATAYNEDGLKVVGPKGSFVIPSELIGITIGRRPNSDTVGIAHSGALTNEKGFVEVDSQRRATDRVFAIGDLTEGPALAHKAIAEGRVAARSACGQISTFDPACIPSVVFGDPQVISVGTSLSSASKRGLHVSSHSIPFGSSGRAHTLGDTDGFIEIIADHYGTVVGIQAVGPHVAELAGEAALAIETAATVEDLAETIHPHPTFGESLMEAAIHLQTDLSAESQQATD